MSILDWLVIEPGSADDSATIQDAIDRLESNGGGEIRLRTGTYRITSTITLRNGVFIIGIRPKLSFDQVCPDLGFNITGGTILQATTGGVTCLSANITADPSNDDPLSNIEIANIGFKGFETVIRCGNTNHLGFGFGNLHDLYIDAEDPTGAPRTDIAFILYNFQHLQINNVKFFNVDQAIQAVSDHVTCQPGNSIWSDVYAYINPSSGRKYEIEFLAGPKNLNAITLLRPQVNWFKVNAPGNDSANIRLAQPGTGDGVCAAFGMYDVDLEGRNDHHMLLEGCQAAYITLATVTPDATSTLTVRDEPLRGNSNKITVVSATANAIAAIFGQSNPTLLLGFWRNIEGGNRGSLGIIWDEDSREYRMPFDFNSGGYFTSPEASSVLRGQGICFGNASTLVTQARTLSRTEAGNILVDISGDQAVTLPLTNSDQIGLRYTVIAVSPSVGTLSINAPTGSTINGTSTTTLTSQYQKVTMELVATNQWIITS